MLFSCTTQRTDHALINSDQNSLRPWSLAILAVLAVSAILYITPAMAADSGRLPSPRSVYQQDRAMCNSGQSNQDRATCLKEAAAAYGEARRGRINEGQEEYEQNALARCSAQPAEDQQACQRRVMGEGVAEGSVQDGGIYRIIETREVMPPSSPRNYPNRY